jgi:hypothetical protein
MTGINRAFRVPVTDTTFFFAVFAAGLLGRAALFFWFDVPGTDFNSRFWQTADQQSLYREALSRHFWDYLLYNHTVAPLVVVWDGLAEYVAGDAPVALVKFVGVCLLDSVAAGVSYLLARRLGVGLWIALATSLLVGSRLAIWNVKTLGGGWDMLGPLAFVLFAYLCVRFIQRRSPSLAFAAGTAGGFAALANNFGPPLVLVGCLAVCIWLALTGGNRRRRLVPLALFLVPMAGCIGAVVTKNGIMHDLWSPGSGSGQNVMQAYNSGLKDPSGRGRGAYLLGKRNGYPDWWLWCYDEAERRKNHTVPNLAGWYGMCMLKLGPDGNAFDFSALEAYVARHPASPVAPVLKRDLETLREEPWLWSGHVSVRATRTNVEYGKISSGIVLDTLFSKPDYFIRRAYRTFFEHWLYHGATAYVTTNRLTDDEPTLLRTINIASVPLSYIGTFLALFHVFRTLWRLFANIRSLRPEAVLGGTDEKIVVLSFVIVGPLIASILLACCENYRHALILLPIILPLAAEAVMRRSFWTGWIEPCSAKLRKLMRSG